MREEAERRPRVGARSVALPCLLCAVLLVPGDRSVPRWTLALAGDVMLGRSVARALGGQWEDAFGEVQAASLGAHLAFANLESPLTALSCAQPTPGSPAGSEGDLSAPPEAAGALRSFGFDLLSLANNHALDCGQSGLRETTATIRSAAITPLLPGEPVCLSAPVRTCWAAFDDSEGGLDEQEAAAIVSSLADSGVLVVVSIHWGGEYQAAPSPRQEALAEALAAAGAGLIAGHGPHVLQRVDWIGDTLVLYSLGNALFDQPYPADARRGAVVLAVVEGTRVVSVTAVATVSDCGRVRLAQPDDTRATMARLGFGPGQEMVPPSR
jgi:poly-gamma-glutamate capsule biosynthesis protein CapA/YwtB (metallophosphatase superfamily)